MTDPKPSATAWCTREMSVAWSRFTTTGAPARSAPATMASACSTWMTLKAPTPAFPALPTMSTVGVSIQLLHGDRGPQPRVGVVVDVTGEWARHGGRRHRDRVREPGRPVACVAGGERGDTRVAGPGRVAPQRLGHPHPP